MGIKIISGKYRGRTIDAPGAARPTLSRNRQSLFDILESLHKEQSCNDLSFFTNKIVIDCFAGSGALGIEALSRGAQYAYFVDNNSEAISVLRSNISKLKAIDSSKIIFSDVNKIRNSNQQECDVVFLDPPYLQAEILIMKTIEYLFKSNWISEKSIMIIETKKTCDIFQQSPSDFNILSSRKIGNSLFTIAHLQRF